MADLKPTVIDEIPFPSLKQIDGDLTGKDSSDTLNPTQIKPVYFPIVPNIRFPSIDLQARTILSPFTFSQFGSIEIGHYNTAAGVRISPNGIVGGVAGVPKFTLNALTGDAIFAGTLAAGVVVASGALIVGTNVGIGTAFPTASAGDLAYEDMVEKAKLGTTIIQGGYIITDLLTANNITTGTLSGITIKTSSNNERIELTNDTIKFYVGNSLKATLDGSSAGNGGVKNTGDFFIANNKSYWIASSGGGSSEYGGIGVDNSNRLILTSGTANNMYFSDNTGSLATDHVMATMSLATVYAKGKFESGDNYIRLNGNNLSVSNNGVSFWHDSSGGRDRNVITWGDGSVIGFDRTGSWIHINGNDKTAIVPTSKGFNALYCAESPEVWFFDFCETKKKIDPMFLEVTEGEMRFIKCDKGYQVWRRRKGHGHKRFELKTKLQFIKNEAFLGLAK